MCYRANAKKIDGTVRQFRIRPGTMETLPKTVEELKEHIALIIRFTAQEVAARRSLLKEVVNDLNDDEPIFSWMKPQKARELDFVKSRVDPSPPAEVHCVENALIKVANDVIDNHTAAMEAWVQNGNELTCSCNENPDAVFELYKDLMKALNAAAA